MVLLCMKCVHVMCYGFGLYDQFASPRVLVRLVAVKSSSQGEEPYFANVKKIFPTRVWIHDKRV
jgi:hypothetical protein